ncbi:MAG: hypothetical protein RIT25_836 [Planctomycetota bacterium]
MTPRHFARFGGLALAALAFCCALPTARAQEQALPPGVTKEIQQSIQRGLDYLTKTQAADGSWRNAGGYGSYPAAMTGLAGMALLCSGSTPTRGPHWKQVRQATEFLMKHSDPNSGVISVPEEEGRSMYGHGFALLFLASVYGMEEDTARQQRLQKILSKAVTLIARSQSAAGGWLYTPDSGGDEGSVTVTQIQALRACRNAGITVPTTTITRAVQYIRKCANADGSIRYSLGSGGEGRPAITAAAVAVLYNAGSYDDPMAEKALEYSKKHVQVSGGNSGHHYYAHLYMSQALYQRGGKDWDDYYARMASWLMKQQRKDGSWDGDGVGTVYGTAIALTILQLPHALAPIYQR